ncbi:MAG: primosomal protein N' [Parvularculaceae bacterium]|nr:MAG: primosomal protein N' [Parvularculaceae bacterium]
MSSKPVEHCDPETSSSAPDGGESADVRVPVLFPTPLPKAYDYLMASPPPHPGTFVMADFGGRLRHGIIWAGSSDAARPGVDPSKLKRIDHVVDAPGLSPEILDFVAWVAGYTMAPLGAVLRLVMRTGGALTPPAGRMSYTLSPGGSGHMSNLTPARKAVLRVASEMSANVRDLAAAAAVGEGVVRGLIKEGALIGQLVDPDPPFDQPRLDLPGKKLSDAQAAAAAQLRAHVREGGGPLLVDGVTGSGKTEVYLEAAAEALRKDSSAQLLILIPEIALTLPFLRRVAERFGAEPAAWHSELGDAARRRVWRRVADGNARIVVGARSALFLPFKNLRLIVVDEEHENAYKQEDGVVYHGRDLAVARGAKAGFPVLLVSATPSLETVVNVDQGRYALVRLSSRFGAAVLPEISLIDLRKTPPEKGAWLSPPLVEAVSDRLGRSEQTLLFLNRRGYAPLTICRKCGERMKSPHSDTWLVEHRFENRLVCHHTGFSMPKPASCPSCKAVDSLAPCGPGVERVMEEAVTRWPDARIELLSSDTAPTAGEMRGVLDRMGAGEIDILVATQMVAKGHHFPNLTCVGVVDADMGLSGGDLRAGERTFQLLSQVAGRAGREARAGIALLQTHQPQAPVLQALANADRDAFLVAEAEGRARAGFPPYGRLAAVILRSPDEQRLKQSAEAHRKALFAAEGIEVMGPAPAPLYRLRGEMRMRFLIKSRREVHIQRFLAEWLGGVKLPNKVRRRVDIDPYSFL